jgi:hypothetical protein
MKIKRFFLTFALFVASLNLFAQSADFQSSFKNPPPAAWPRAWWHWTNGNVTKTGITKDLEWMKRVGIQGMQMGDVASGGGQTVTDKVNFGSPEWLDALKHTATEAQRLNLEMAMFTSAGWSLTGGPWVKPGQAMKKLVWSETHLAITKSSAPGSIKLKQPPSSEGAGPLLQGGQSKPGFYKDYAVVAFKTPPAEMFEDNNNHPIATTSKGVTDAATLFDQDLSTGITVPEAADKTAWIQLAYHTPFHARAITLGARGRGVAVGKLQVSNDGINFKTILTTPGKLGYRPGTIHTYAFPDVTAKFYRLVFTNAAPQPGEIISEVTTAPIGDYPMTEITLHSGARINRWQEKAGFNQLFEYSNVETPPQPSDAEIKKESIIDLTSKMLADGTLKWDAPKGNWTILRFGYALTGAKNRPAVPAGSGYEADKMSVQDVSSYMDGYTTPLKKALGPLYGKSLQYMVMDSWEAGITNWTERMPEDFMERRGYNILPYMPALAGYVVDNPTISERFLWDFRRTIVDLIAQNHYGTVTDYLHKDGIKTYSEAGGVSLESTEDALLNKKYVDIPMGEFWVKDLHPSSMYYEDMRGAASASHVYGKGLVAAESFTGGNYEAPARLKNLADYWFTQGLNRMVFHTSAQQPLDTKPGNTMVGTHINRNITWAELSRPFMTYLARNMYMLQRGIYTADIVYLLGEGAPSTMPFWGAGVQPATPEGYLFDYINTDALLTRVSVNAKGKLILPDGLQYSVLVLPPTSQMTLPVLQKIKSLVQGGAIILGPKPTSLPGLSGYPTADDEMTQTVFDMWGDLDGISRTMKDYGKGKVYWGIPLDKVLKTNGVREDVADHRTLNEVSWIHRHDGDKEIYLVVNRTDSTQKLRIQFRVTGKEPTLWHPDHGNSEGVSYQMNADNTEVPLILDPKETIYVVFDKATDQKNKVVIQYTQMPVAAIDGPWQLSFPANWGAPTAVQQLDKLTSWTESADDGIKYFSGTATYTKTFDVKKAMLKNGKLSIDLGTVGDIAVVTVNGSQPDTLWHAPYRTNLGSQLKAGKNTIEVKITNEWTNRIAGDALAPADKKILAPGPPPFNANRAVGPKVPVLPAAGLMGPVTIEAEVKVKE